MELTPDQAIEFVFEWGLVVIIVTITIFGWVLPIIMDAWDGFRDRNE